MGSLAWFSISINYALTVFNICFSLYMKEKDNPIWWINIPVAVFCFIFATLRFFI